MRAIIAVAAVAAVAVAAVSARQSPPAAPLAQFRSAVDIVHLDVSVLDRNRRPVRGLTPADFTILEDGAPRPLAVFQAVDIPDLEPAPAAWIRNTSSEVLTNDDVQERRLFLMVLDDATIQGDPNTVKNVREIAGGIIDRFGPTDLVGVIFTRDNRGAQDFTADRARLRAAVGTFSLGFRDLGLFDAEKQEPIPGQDDLFYMSSVNVLQRTVEVLSGMPDRRKAIIYIGQGVPVNLEALGPTSAGLPVLGGSSDLMQAAMVARIKTQLEGVFLHARRANINVYSLDACGLRVPPPARKIPIPKCVPGLEVDYLRTVSANTGGRAVVETNDFQPGVAAIFAENASYYLLGFQPAHPGQDGEFRRLDVRVNRPDVEVRTRTGYQADKVSVARKRTTTAEESPLGTALAGLLPKSDLPLQMTAVAIGLPDRREAAVAIAVGVRQPVRESAGPAVEHVDLQVSAFNADGKAFGSRRLVADVAIRAGATGLAEYDVLTQIDLKPGRYQLRMAASIGSLKTSGSLYYDVDVPDFSSAPVSLSGLMLSASPAPLAAPRDALRAILPIVPTTRRTFTGSDQVTAFARVYQGGKTPLTAVPLRVQLSNERGVVIMDRRQDIAVEQFTAARSADLRVSVPVSKLTDGEYLLAIDTEMRGAAARRTSRFRVGTH